MPGTPRILTDADIKEQRRKDMDGFELRTQREAEAKNNSLTAAKLREAASTRKAWIYDPVIKRWYTPDEFFELTAKYYADHKIFYQVKIKDPLEGLEAGYKQMEQLQERLKAFSRKIMEYYRR
jgi:hypothetical protein